MSDWKDTLRNSQLHRSGGGDVKKKCQDCGNEFMPREPHHRVCGDCIRRRRDSNTGFDRPGARLREDYLNNGYFDDKGQLRAGIFKEEAKDVANIFASLKMTPTSLRAFYNKLRAIETQYKMSTNFDLIKPKLYAFERDVAYQVSRGVVSEEFRTFINKNSELACKGPKEFKGFVEHFLSVLAYFKDVSKQ